MLKIEGMRDVGRPPVIDIRVTGGGETVLIAAVVDTMAATCVFDTRFAQTFGTVVDVMLTGLGGETLTLQAIAATYRDLTGGDARLGWSALEHLNIVLHDNHSFEITGHSIA